MIHDELSSTVGLNVYRESRPHRYLGNTLDDGITVPAQGGFVRPIDAGIGAEHLTEIVDEVTRLASSGLSLAGCHRIDDQAMAGIACSRLEFLELYNTAVGDRGLPWLPKVPELQHLSLAGTRVDDRGLSAVAALPHLTELDLGWTEVTDRGLEHLRGHRGLVTLSLRATRLTDHGLEVIATLPHLQYLDLQETAVGDDGVTQLRPLATTLQHLLLGYTTVTGRCMPDLLMLGRLRTLLLRATRIGREHDGELAARPQLRVVR
ncbi:MAG: hypothetical protein NT062_08975 [Proteobacteria bacterium]|nr:hypothetical protein [Pseudomonadota bacterium]